MRGILAVAALGIAACVVPVQQQQPSAGGGDPYAAPPPSGGEGGEGGGGGGGGAAAAPPGPVSVTIRSSCSQTVRVFYGDKPKYGSGTTSSISSNSVNSHSFQPGDMFWIVDESDNGVDSVTLGPGITTIQINSDCRSISTR